MKRVTADAARWVKLMTRRYPENDFAARLCSPGVAQDRSGFITMVIAEWHKLVADLSRPFARRRIHHAAAEHRQATARVRPLQTSKGKPRD